MNITMTLLRRSGVGSQTFDAQCLGVFSCRFFCRPGHGCAFEIGDEVLGPVFFETVSDAHFATKHASLHLVNLNTNIKRASVFVWTLLELVVLKHMPSLGEAVASGKETYHIPDEKYCALEQKASRAPAATMGTCTTKAGVL